MNDPKLDRLLELLERQIEGGGNPSAGINGDRPDNKTYTQRVNELIKSSKEAANTFNRLNSGLRLTSRAQFEHRMASQEAGEELHRLQRVLRDHRRGTKLLTDEQYKEVEARRKELESTQRQTRAGDMFAGSLLKWGGFLINYFSAVQTATVQGITNVMSTIQAGGSGFAIANAQMAMELDIANVHAQQLATATQMAGASMMLLPGIGTKIAGAGVGLLGMQKAAESQLMTMAQKAYNQILMTGGEQVLKAYKDLTKAGVIVAGGADAMNQALRGRGGKLVVSFDELSRMAAQNTEELARSRLGVGEAALMMGRIAKVIREQKIERGLLAIGIGLEDFGGIVASTMADMRANNPGRVLKDTEVMAKSLEYAKTLSLLSQLTGKSVKELKDRGKEAEAELAYQAFIAQLKNPELKQAFDKLPPMIRQSAVEFAKFGNIRNDIGRFASQTVPGFTNYVQELATGLKSNRMTPDMLIDINSRYSRVLNDGILENQTLSTLAAAGNSKYANILSELSKIAIEYQGFAGDIKGIRERQNEEMREATEGPKPGQQPTMSQTLTDIENAGKTLVANFQGEIIDRIPLIGRMIKDALERANRIVTQGPEAILQAGQMPNLNGLFMAMIAAGLVGQILFMAGRYVATRMGGLFGGKPGTPTTTTETGTRTGAVTETKTAVAEPTGAKASSIIDPKTGKPFVIEAKGPTAAEIAASEKVAAQAAKNAKILETTAKATKLVKGVAVAGTVVAVGEGVVRGVEAERKYERGEITRQEAYAQQTGIATDVAGGLASAYAGGKVGAVIGGIIGAWFGGVGAAPGALVGGILGSIGGALTYYLTPLSTWTKKVGEGFSRWWQSWSFKGIWDTIGSSLESSMTTVSSWAKSSLATVKGWFSSDNTPRPAPGGAQSGTAIPAAATANLPSGLKVLSNGGLAVSLVKDGNAIDLTQNAKTVLTEAFGAALRSAQGGPTPAARTSPSVSGLYDPVTKKGRMFGETDFQEVGKYDPVVYALGKLTKIQAEHVELSREMAVAMKLNVRQTTESGRYLRSMNRAFQ